jgi:hypothetical protein
MLAVGTPVWSASWMSAEKTQANCVKGSDDTVSVIMKCRGHVFARFLNVRSDNAIKSLTT